MGERRDEAIGKIFNVCPGGKQLLLMLCRVNQHSLKASKVDDQVSRLQHEYSEDTIVSMWICGCENVAAALLSLCDSLRMLASFCTRNKIRVNAIPCGEL